jgi:hypothetical protein
MKKFLALGALTLAGLAFSAADADAWLFHDCHINRYSTFIACRPYNAFTPVCYGSIVCDGCCPAPFCGGCPPMWRPQTMPPVMAGPPSCCDLGCGPGDHALASLQQGPVPYHTAAAPPLQPMPYPMPYPMPQPFAQPYPQPMPYAQTMPPMTQPVHIPQHTGPMPPPGNGPVAPNFMPPAPTPVPPQTSQQGNPQAGQSLQPAGYYPSYAPAAYYPMQNYLMYPASTTPSYWYGR